MDAFGYKSEEDGNIWFSWVFIHAEGQTLWLNGILGEVQGSFMHLGEAFSRENFDTKTIPMLEGLGYVFDFNDKSQEIHVRFPLANISDLYDFRFNRVEPILQSALQRSGNGFCDTGFCDDAYLNMVAWVYSLEAATRTISAYLPKVLGLHELNFSVWISENGVLQKIWEYGVESPSPTQSTDREKNR